MSLKIYNGLRFVSPDLLEVYAALHDFRPAIEEMMLAAERTFLVKRAVDIIDAVASGIPGLGSASPLGQAWDELRERQRKVHQDRRRDPEVDFEFTVTVIPSGGRVYGMVFTEHREWRKALLAQPWVEDFPYWNNSDGPDDLTAEEWEERRQIWELALAPDYVPSNHGMTFEVTKPPRIATPEELVAAAPPREARVLDRAKGAVMFRRVREMDDLDKQRGVEKPIGDNLMPSLRWVENDPEAKKQVEAEIPRFEALLPEITAEILWGKS